VLVSACRNNYLSEPNGPASGSLCDSKGLSNDRLRRRVRHRNTADATSCFRLSFAGSTCASAAGAEPTPRIGGGIAVVVVARRRTSARNHCPPPFSFRPDCSSAVEGFVRPDGCSRADPGRRVGRTERSHLAAPQHTPPGLAAGIPTGPGTASPRRFPRAVPSVRRTLERSIVETIHDNAGDL